MQLDPSDDLRRAAAGDPRALERVLPLIHSRIHEVASQVLAGDRVARWVQASSLVQQALLRLVEQRTVNFEDEARVMAVLTTLMRRIVVDVARRETADKRGGRVPRVSLHSEPGPREVAAPRIDALEIEDALVALSNVDPEAARVAELRLWGGMELAQIAVAVDIPAAKARRLWHRGKAWLARDLAGEGDKA